MFPPQLKGVLARLAVLMVCLGLLGKAAAPAQGPPEYLLGMSYRTLPGHGIEVQRVYPNTPAERIGLRPGDVIVSINGRSVVSGYEFRRAMDESRGNVRLGVRDVRTGQITSRSGRMW